ncbi:MAG: hypothetical protein GWN00_12450, partial [Aliifodinibius sp.]|nr:hypothetical protein [Fodinibius sp.]NIV11953.1 hypothetical protein [Fodinibius sp.]NIY25589.1 hypothetical protein [Fodinibius sp.]
EDEAEDKEEENEKQDTSEKIEKKTPEDSLSENSESSTEEQEEPEKDTEITAGSEETPMWMRYMSEDEIEEYKEELGAEEDEEVDEDGFIDEPIIDLTKENASDEEIENLRNMLADDEE